MCGRYVIARASGDLLGGVELEESLTNYNVAPTHTVPILVDHPNDGGFTREIHGARWGLLPVWAKDESFSSRAFNARSETVTEKPTFRHAVKSQRCAIPATGYYEWKKSTPSTGGRTQKTPFYVHPENSDDNIYFAGLYEWWKIPEGEHAGEWLLSTTILTMPSPGESDAEKFSSETLNELGELHDRLPIPLRYSGDDNDELSVWMRAQEEADVAVERIRGQAYDVAREWVLTEVGREVGSVAHNGPELIQPVERLI
ncbi:SOS response-associated peptidase [Kocuria massiliensis]|uniref:SOS response-associated peptidase n=1 Tax=Kocuria massiliensis TaxID=1926282 RepID=UPI000A1CBD64|nr:SOS response-associated peptidase [Kocuria massiliensis]MCT1367466.1 SOS response-associated peptidase [Rothia sp. p3-SID1597]